MTRFEINAPVAAKAAAKAVTKAVRGSAPTPPANCPSKPVTRAAARVAAIFASHTPIQMLTRAAANAPGKAADKLARKAVGRFAIRVAARAAKHPEPKFIADRFQSVSQQDWNTVLLSYTADQPVNTRNCEPVEDGLHSAILTMEVSGTGIALGLYYLDQLEIRHPALVREYAKGVLFVAAMMLADQVLDDSSYEVSSWAAVSGLSQTAISQAARAICDAFGYLLHPRPGVFRAFETKLLRKPQAPAA